MLAGAAILAYFLLLTHGGVRTWFSGDDVVNIAFLHGYGRVPLFLLATEAVSVFTPEYRPVGGVYYRLLYALFGLNAAPFRVLFFVLLLVNMALAAVWMKRISASPMTAFAGVALFSYHAAISELYYNDGTIYDVLCMLFLMLFFVAYSRMRERGALSARSTFELALLLGAALGSKEMAAVLPPVLVLYEVLFGPRNSGAWRRIRPILVFTVTTVVCMSIKVLVPNYVSANDAYRPRLDLSFIGSNYLFYHRLLLFDPGMNGAQLLLVLTAALVLATVFRNRVMLFGLLFSLVALIPVCVILRRYGFVCYIPLFGYSLYIGEGISIVTGKLTTAAQYFRRSYAIPCLVAAALLVMLYAVQRRQPRNLPAILAPQQHNLKMLLTAARSSAPSLPAGSRILLKGDPFPPVAWEVLFVLRLGYKNPSLWVDRNPKSDDAGLYAMIMNWTGTGYTTLTPPGPSTTVAIDLTPGTVRRGEALTVRLPPHYANCQLDVAYRMPEDELMRAGVWRSWATLDAAGIGTVHINQAAERGRVSIDHIRACNNEWATARADFVISP